MKVALVYDRVNKWGGAERVLLSLHKLFPEAPLYTAVYNPSTAKWAKIFPRIITSGLQHIPFATKNHEYYPFLMPIVFENFSFEEYDLVITLTSEAAKGIITKPHTKHLCICLTPTRYLWSGYKEYFKNALFRFLTRPLIGYLKTWDKIAAHRPDKLIAISKEVKNRIQTYYNLTSDVIYPPSVIGLSTKSTAKGEYFLVVSRLSQFTIYKRIDLAIKAANTLGLPLKIVGEGNFPSLKKIAGPTVTFEGGVSDERLLEYYANCRAVIFPAKEDFGLVMVEAQAFGKPVIAFRAGGALEIIKEGQTGEFFDEQTVDSLVETLQRFETNNYNSGASRQNAKRFSEKIFHQKIRESIASLL